VTDYRGALEGLERILNRGGDPDDVLREVVALLHRHFAWVAIHFVEAGELQVGPHVGELAADAVRYPISFNGARVAELEVAPAGDGDRAFLERVALIVSPYCLVAWDTGGVAWDDVS
jgi:putative methionine-R-sulfoxide reductase with GAF domain